MGAVGVVRGKGAADVDVSRCFLVPGLVAISNPFLVPPRVVDVDHFPFLSVPDATKAEAGRARVFFYFSCCFLFYRLAQCYMPGVYWHFVFAGAMAR